MNTQIIGGAGGAAACSAAPYTPTPPATSAAHTPTTSQGVDSAAHRVFPGPNAGIPELSPAQVLLGLIPVEQKTTNSARRCGELMGGIDQEFQEQILGLIKDCLHKDLRQAFIKVIEPLAAIREGRTRLVAIALVLQVDSQNWDACVEFLINVPFKAFTSFVREFSRLPEQKNYLILRIVAPTLWNRNVSEWANIIRFASSLSHLRVREEDWDGLVCLESGIKNGIALLLDSATPSAVRADSFALFSLLPRNQRDVTSLRSCIDLSSIPVAEVKHTFIEAIQALARRTQGELRLGIMALVQRSPDIARFLERFSGKDMDDLGATVERFPEDTRSTSLQELVSVLPCAHISEWASILKVALPLLPLKELGGDWNPVMEGVAFIKQFPVERRESIIELVEWASLEQRIGMIAMAAGIPEAKKSLIFREIMPLLCSATRPSELSSTLQLAALLSQREVRGQGDGSTQNAIREAVILLCAVEDASVRTSSMALFALLPQHLRDNAHLNLCIKMASSQNHEAVVAAFKRIPEARRGIILEVLAPRSELRREIRLDSFIEIVVGFPEGEEGEICAILELAMPMLREVSDRDNLAYGIRLFGLLPRAQRDPRHLEVCISLFSDIPQEERNFLAKASAEDIITVMNGIPPAERGAFFRAIGSLSGMQERRVRANAIELFAQFPEDQRTEEHLRICVDLMEGSYPLEGKGIVEVVKSLSLAQRRPFLERGAVNLRSEANVWFKKDVLTLFRSFVEEERDEVNLQNCITLLSGPVKYFERDLIIKAIKTLPEVRRAAFVSTYAHELSLIENMLQRVYRTRELVV